MSHPGLYYGTTLVPWSVLWSGEQTGGYIAPCRYAAGMPSMFSPEKPGSGKPIFGQTHEVRQRRAVAECLCEVCGKSIKTRTKISLSNQRPTSVDGATLLLVVEPLCCRPCAALSIQHCPHLKAQRERGELQVLQVFAYRIVAQQLTGVATKEFCGEQRPGTVGHLKIQITKWADRDLAWLGVG